MDLIDVPASRLGVPPGSIVTDEEAEQNFASGKWARRSLAQFLDDAVAAHPDRVAAVSIDSEGRVSGEMTYAELDRRSRRVAAGLQAIGVQPRDVVSVMMTNSAEFLAVVYGVLRAGATYSGIPITYGSHEVEFMTSRTAAKVLVVSRLHSGRDVLATSVPGSVVNREGLSVVVVGEPVDGTRSLESLLADESDWIRPSVDPLAIAQLAFTSGTTSEPKAVMNLHATLDVVVRGWVAHVGARSYGEPMRNLVMSPVGHSTGFMWGALITPYLAGTAVFLEKWSPALGADIIAEQNITCMVGSPTFMIDLLRTAGLTAQKASSIRFVVVAGAPIPRPLMRELVDALGCDVIPAWGMTEFGIAVSGRPGLGKINAVTDGIVLDTAQVSIRDADGAECANGKDGALWIKGGGLFVGYHGKERLTRAEFDAGGWFATGDTAVRAADGSVTITGRTKDIIIRGGENIPVGSVENFVFQHPSVLEVAVVGYPDSRLGERACAFVRCRPGESLTLEELKEHLTHAGLAKRYFPERIVVIDELPKTMSGKIRKVELRGQLASDGGN